MNGTCLVRNDFMLGESMLKSIRDWLLPMEMAALTREWLKEEHWVSRFTSTIQLHLYSYCRFSHRQYVGSCNTLSTLAAREGLFISLSTERYSPSPIHCSYLFRPNRSRMYTQSSLHNKHRIQTSVKRDAGDLLLREEEKGNWKRKL